MEGLLQMKKASFLALMALFLSFPLFASPLGEEGKTLMSIKASFSNVANVLLDWNYDENEDYCSWRGIACDNVTFSVVSLNLSNLNLGGEISPAFGDLRSLQTLDLKGENNIMGELFDYVAKELKKIVATEDVAVHALGSQQRELGFTISFPVSQRSESSAIVLEWADCFKINDIYEFGLKSCFHDEFQLIIARLALGSMPFIGNIEMWYCFADRLSSNIGIHDWRCGCCTWHFPELGILISASVEAPSC